MNVMKEEGTFGLRIAGGKGKPFGGGFIYVKSLVKGTPAGRCNKLKERDIIVKVSILHTMWEELTAQYYALLQINGRSLVDITHREVATLIVTTPSDNVELVVHRPESITWLESSHELYLSKQKVKGMRKMEVSWTELEPWMEQQPIKPLTTIKEGGEGSTGREAADVEVAEDADELATQLPGDDPPSVAEEEPPSLPEEGPPSLIEEDLPNDDENMLPQLSLSEDSQSEAHIENTKRHCLQKEASVEEDTPEGPLLPHVGEPPFPPEGEPPPPPQGEPPSNEELSWEQTSDQPECVPGHDQSTALSSAEVATSTAEQRELISFTTAATEDVDFTRGQATADGHETEPFSTPTHNTSGSTEDDSFKLNASFDEVDKNIFTVTLKKGFRGLGFLLDKERSQAEGESSTCT